MPPEGGFFVPPLPSPTPGYVMFGSNYPAGNSGVVGSDLINAGDDYAIRVQQFDADVKGNITENLSWRIGFWGMKKEGTRQANTQQHCSSYAGSRRHGSRCHVMTQGQSIDWLTAQVEPGIAWQTDWFSVEYSRTMRSFQQDDQAVFGDYRREYPPYGFGQADWLQQLGHGELHRDRPGQGLEPSRPGHRHVCARLGRQHAQQVA